MTTDLSSKKLRLWGILILTVTFVFGGFTGMGVSQFLHRRPPHPHHPPHGMPGHLAELNLSAEQEKKAREIDERKRVRLEKVVKKTFPEVRTIHEESEKELMQILTPKQRKQFAERPRHHFPPPHGRRPPGHMPPMGPPH